MPLSGIAALADGVVKRGVADESAVHVDHGAFGDAQTLGDELDLIRAHVAIVERGNAALRLAQVEEQLPMTGRGAHPHQGP